MVEKHANYLLTTDYFQYFFCKLFLNFFFVEITLNLKNLQILQHSQVGSNQDNDTCVPKIN